MQYVKFSNTGMDFSHICIGKENGVFPWAKSY